MTLGPTEIGIGQVTHMNSSLAFGLERNIAAKPAPKSVIRKDITIHESADLRPVTGGGMMFRQGRSTEAGIMFSISSEMAPVAISFRAIACCVL